jgi:nucleoid DNA-binding protein
VRKQDLASVVATETKLTPRRAEQIINVTLKAIENALLDGDSVTLTGFGTLKLVDRQERAGTHPRTGERIRIPAHRATRFSAGDTLRRKVAVGEVPVARPAYPLLGE